MATELDVETQEVYEVPVYEELDGYHANLLVYLLYAGHDRCCS
jgi:hypothetical protein